MIETTGLVYRYGSGTEICFPDVSVPQGGAMLLQGPSGAGKSTWLALAGAMLRPCAGRIAVAGQDITTLTRMAGDAWRSRTVGFLPQRLHLSEGLNVADNLAMAQWAAGVPGDAAAIHRALEALGVDTLARRKPSQLSGGQAQRVALARAVLLHPHVILADEPTASLDDAAAQSAIGLLAAHAARCGATLVIATHDSRVASALPGAAVCRLGGAGAMR